MNWNDNEVKGKIDEVTGKVKEHIGRANADPILEEEGANQRTSGEIEHGFGKARRKVGEAVKDIGDKLGR